MQRSLKGYFVYVENERFKKATTDPDLEKYKHLIEEAGDDDTDVPERAGSSSSGLETLRSARLRTCAQIRRPAIVVLQQSGPGATGKKYELQLMPKAIMDLEGLDGDIVGGMSWGTIVVFTSEDDFIPEENFDEHAVGILKSWPSTSSYTEIYFSDSPDSEGFQLSKYEVALRAVMSGDYHYFVET
ncbi:hypothetical protein Cantr_01282 [Candida viswanathii]|uniref:Programmed cell death protein 2 C-terminal domain-containing protein n=1 Tax=Candida viswanathii TaxID=5486 RepID=A0A367YII3_9ASCO|nr:hypothetical protein Cantr_01282 [Candida viswanathii]